MKHDNPFFHRGPIRDPRFFWNRTEELAHARLLLDQGQSVSIVGPRRIGKSSLLLQLVVAARASIGNDRYVYFNCEGWSAATPASLYALLLEAIGADTLHNDAPLEYRAFRAEVLKATPPAARLVLMLDEFESLSANPNLDAGFFSGLRALASTGRVVFVTASARSLGWLTFAEPTALSSPFFNIFTQINLQPLGNAEAVGLLRHFSAQAGTPFSEAVINFVLGLSGPHPFFIQIGAFYAYEQIQPGNDEIDRESQAWVRQHYVMQAEPHWRYAWSELQPIDHRQLAFSTDLTTCPEAMLQRLRALALVVDDSGGPRLLSPLLETFFSRQPVKGLLQAPPLVMDEAQHRIGLDDYELDLNGLEYKLLRLLAVSAGDVVTQTTIQSVLWPNDESKTDNVERLKSVVKSLRRKLGAHSHLIQNVRAIGYTFAGERIDSQA